MSAQQHCTEQFPKKREKKNTTEKDKTPANDFLFVSGGQLS